MSVTIGDVDVYDRPSFQKTYINVRQVDLHDVEDIISEYCDKYGDGALISITRNYRMKTRMSSFILYSFRVVVCPNIMIANIS